MINTKAITDAMTTIASIEPDIAIVLTAYNILHGIWTVVNPGKTEEDYQNYLKTTSQTNVDTTSVYLRAQGYIEETPGNWKKP